MRVFELLYKHFRNINLLDAYFERYYLEQQRQFYKYAFTQLDSNCSIEKHRETSASIIVSLTSYGQRVKNVYLTLTSLLLQTITVSKIVLWLSEKEFNDTQLPYTLRKMRRLGVEIRYCEDLKSYKKIVPTLIKYPNEDIITVDDDIIYPFDFIEKLLEAHTAYPNKVCFTRGWKIGFDRNNMLLPYKQWQKASNDDSMLNVPTGVGGVLYPAGCFHSDVCKKEIFMELCPNADDLWLRAMCILQKVDTFYLSDYSPFSHYFIEIPNTQKGALNTINNTFGEVNNDAQFKRLYDYYNLRTMLG